MGRKPLITGAQHQEALRLAADNRTHLEISRILRVSRSTVSRFLARNPQD
jgi:DNA-binding CsgD family transcriptional regulator